LRLITKKKKDINNKGGIFMKIRRIFEWNFGILLLLISYMPISFYTFIQLKYFDAKSYLSYVNLLGAIFLGIGFII